MTCASLVAFLLLGQVSEVDPSDLIAQLGSSRYAERQAATAALAQLGRRALPALKSAGEQKDPEIRTRAAALMARIEGALLTEASQVTLDFQDLPRSSMCSVRSAGRRACGSRSFPRILWTC